MLFTTHTDTRPWFKIAIASILIVAMLFMFTPRRSDGIILALLGPIIAGSVVATIITEIIIYCAIGLICGGGGGGGSTPGGGGPGGPGGGSCDTNQGSQCQNQNACGDLGPADGTVQCDGTCSSTPMPDYTYNDCSSGANYCGMTATGDTYCDGTCTATTPSNNLCTGLPFPPVVPGTPGTEGLVINPAVVRVGDTITIQWDLGQNYPPNCTLTGTGVGPGNTYTFGINDRTGSRTITNVTSPYNYTLTCGTSTVSRTVYLLPVISET